MTKAPPAANADAVAGDYDRQPREELAEVLGEIVDAAIEMAGADFGNIQIIDASGTLKIAVQRNFPDWWVAYWENVSAGHGSCGTALARGEQVFIEDVETSPVFAGTPALDIQRRAGVRAVQSTPLRSRSGQVVGMLSTHYRTPHRPNPEELRLLRLLATQAAGAILRGQAEQARRDSEARYRIFFDNAAIGTAELAPDGHFLRVNARLREMLGYSLGELRQLTPDDIIHPGDLERERPRLRAFLAGESSSYRGESRYVRKDGGSVWCQVCSTLFRNDLGTPQYAIAIIEDISDRKRAEEQLASSRATLEAALASMSDAVFISDAEGTFVHVNEAFATFHRFESKDSCVKTLAEYPEFLDVFLDTGELLALDQWAVPRALRGETVVGAEYRLFRKDTGQQWIGSYNFAPIRDPSGGVVGCVVTGRDITEQRQALETLRRSEMQMRLALDAARAGAWEWEIASDQNTWSESLWPLFGLDRDKCRPSYAAWVDTIAPEDRPGVTTRVADAVAAGREFEIEWRVKGDGGASARWLFSRGQPMIDPDGSPRRYIGIVIDITERKRLEEMLRRMAVQATLAEECERRGIAEDLHDDVGQILHVCRLKLDMLARALAKGGAEAAMAEEVGTLLLTVSSRVRSLISQLSPPVLKELGLDAALRWLAGEMERHYGLTVTVEGGETAPPLTPAQSAILFRMIRELLINVSKHAGTDAAHVRMENDGDRLRLSVTDEGVGMEDWQGIMANCKGFGLPSIRERIKFLRGDLAIVSHPGDGTEVTVELPFERGGLPTEESVP